MALEMDLHCHPSHRMLVEACARFLKTRVPSLHILRVVLYEGCPSLAHEVLTGLRVRSQLVVVVAMTKETIDKIIINRLRIFTKSTIPCVPPPRSGTQWFAVVDLDSIEVMTTPLPGCPPIRQPWPSRTTTSDPLLDLLHLVGRVGDEGFFLHPVLAVESARSSALRCIVGSRMLAIRLDYSSILRCAVTWFGISRCFRRCISRCISARRSEFSILRGLVVHAVLRVRRVEDTTVSLIQLVSRGRSSPTRGRRSRSKPSTRIRLRIRSRSFCLYGRTGHRRTRRCRLIRTVAGAISISARRRWWRVAWTRLIRVDSHKGVAHNRQGLFFAHAGSCCQLARWECFLD